MLQIHSAAFTPERLSLPLFLERCQAGFPSPAADYTESELDLNGVNLDIENYCTLRSFFDLPTLAGRSRRNLPEAGIRLLFQI